MHQSDTVIQSVVDSFARELLAADEAVPANLPDYGDREFINGVVIGDDGSRRMMTDEEIGLYD